MDYSTLDDDALIRLIARANADALGALYDRYSRLVFSIALNAVGDWAAAEEITLDVFTRVWEKSETYQAERARVSTWLTSVARHRAIDVLRRRRARPEQHTVPWPEVQPDEMPHVNSPEETVELSLQQRRVRAAIATLPQDQKRALAMAYFQGLTHSEIAERLGEPLGTVKTRIRLAMQKLRQLLQSEQMAPGDTSKHNPAAYNE